MVLGVIFFMLLLAGTYFLLVDPLNLKPLLFEEPTKDGGTLGDAQMDKNPLLTEGQEQALETIGVDPAALPTSITPSMEVCFVEVLGEKRVGEIKGGDTPTPVEFFTARDCIE